MPNFKLAYSRNFYLFFTMLYIHSYFLVLINFEVVWKIFLSFGDIKISKMAAVKMIAT